MRAAEALTRIGPVTRWLGLYVSLVVLWILFGPSADAGGGLARWLVLPASLAAVWMPLRAERRRDVPAGIRRAWFLVGVAALCQFAGYLWWVWLKDVRGEDPSRSQANVPLLTYYLFAVAALLTFPLSFRSRQDRLKFVLDALMMTVGGGLLILHFVILPDVRQLAEPLDVLPLAYPVGDLICLVGVSRILLRTPAGVGHRPVRLLAGAFLLHGLGNVLWIVLKAAGHAKAGGLADAFWVVDYLLLAAAGEDARREVLPTEGAAPVARPSLLPYVAALLGYGLLVFVSFGDRAPEVRHVAIGSIVLTVIVLLRQLVSVRENLDLLAEQNARASEARFKSLVQNSSDVITILSPEGRIRYASPAAERVLGYAPEEMAGRRFHDYLASEYVEEARHLIERAVRAKALVHEAEWRFQRADGTWIHVENRVMNMLDDPNIGGLVVNTRDVSERHALEGKLYRQAFHDGLTALPNRTLFRDRVEHALKRGQRRSASVAVLFVDVDDFKAVNDSMGHHRGDDLLRSSAERLRRCMRDSDTVARLGGDEFAILVEDAPGAEGVVGLAERVSRAFAAPFLLDGREVPITVSVGIAMETPGDTVDVLLRNADVAMYAAKGQGRGRWAVFEPSMHAAVVEQMEMQADLHGALERDELTLHYQPIIDLRTGTLWGVEALVRWNHPRRGWVPPSAFIPIAERTGLILPLGEWILERACRDAASWGRARPDAPALCVTVNLAVKQLREPGLPESVARALAATGLEAARLVLEITESALLEEDNACRLVLEGLKRMGVRIAIDDFGTGYSSLSYLQQFPLHVLKVAKPFVDRMQQGVPSPALPRAVVSLGDTLGLDTIAEGVETEHQASELKAIGCRYGQGFYWSRPVPGEQILDLIGATLPRGGKRAP